MDQGGRSGVAAIGYLSVVTDPRHGLFGGYLIVNSSGRPLEFHCTAPVRANRAQEILYGPTLRDFLYGEHIGRTLVERGETVPDLFCTDSIPMLALRPSISKPLALVLAEHELPEAKVSQLSRVHEVHANAPYEKVLTARNCRVTCASTHPDDLTAIDRLLPDFDNLDLAEPFERIYAAIEEAHGPTRPENEAA
ncbi:MAG: hypothetical protein WBF93_18595 [Pirellulales bacterium]|nr:hypothetical protein [Pirellulales bacterium]